MYMSLHKGRKLFCRDDVTILDCDICGFAHMDPLPTLEMIENIYDYDYYANEKSDYISAQEAQRDWWIANYSHRLRQIEQLSSGTGRRILDIGSGPGLFLQAAKKQGWSAVGIEPNKLAADHARLNGGEVLELYLKREYIPLLGKFNAIHCSEVLEHIQNPQEIVEIMHDLLTPGGVVFCLAPNDFNPIQAVLTGDNSEKKWWVSTPHHINYFNHHSLSQLFANNKFSIERVTSTFPIDLFLLMDLNYIGNTELGKYCHSLRMNFEKNLMKSDHFNLLEQFYERLAQIGLGREAIVIARKTD